MENKRPSWWPKDWTEWEVGQHLAERSEALREKADKEKMKRRNPIMNPDRKAARLQLKQSTRSEYNALIYEAQLIQDNNAQTANLLQRLNPNPVPAYVVQNPNCCGAVNFGCGCA